MGTGLTRNLRLGSGLVLFTFVCMHFINHALGNISLQAMEAGREVFTAIWRNWPATILLYGAMLLHILTALLAIWRRRTLRMSRSEAVQIVLALCIPFLLSVHILATRGLHELFGINDSYLYEIISIWVFEPLYGWTTAAAVLIVWGHGCLGMHHWLRLKPWYDRARVWLFVSALLLPALALSGYAGVGKQIALLARDQAWMNAAIASFKFSVPIAELKGFAFGTADYVQIGVAVVLALLLLGRWLRHLLARRGARIDRKSVV